MRSMTAGVLSLGDPRGLKPLVPSGPFGWRTTVTWRVRNEENKKNWIVCCKENSITLSPPLAASSKFMVLSLEISLSGLLEVHSFRTQQAECFLVRWFVTTTNSTSSPTY